MTDTLHYGAGWGAADNMMSHAIRARVGAADAQYEREAAAQRRERAERIETAREQAIRASIEAALERGEVVDIREAIRNGGVGRTRAEIVAYASAQMDREDAILRRQAAKQIAQVGERTFYEQHTGDTSAPAPLTQSERAQVERGRTLRGARREIWKAIRTADRLSHMGLRP